MSFAHPGAAKSA